MARVSPWLFWLRFAGWTVKKHAILIATICRMTWWGWRIGRDPNARTYTDLALTPVEAGGDETLDLLTKTDGAAAAVARGHKFRAVKASVA